MKKAVVILSGGLDSTVLLHSLKRDGVDVLALSFDYGQRHRRELKYAMCQAHIAGVPHRVADLTAITNLLANGSALLPGGVDVPTGHYEAETMKATVVPNRNMIMLSIATGYAVAQEADAVAYAAHPGDHAIYPDCRPDFAYALERAIALCDWHKVTLVRPFVERSIDKAGIVRLGAELGVDMATTWSCYKGGDVHCGECGTCVERREAFVVAGVDDPTPYAPGARSLDEMLAVRGDA